MISQEKKIPWWHPDYGFFGQFYFTGDNSLEGYLPNQPQTLHERTKCEVSGLQNLLDLQPDSSILDCPCGYGRHSTLLAHKGFDVTGIDINPRYINAANAVNVLKNLTFIKQNMLDLSLTARFHVVINMFLSFGFFETDEENEQVLNNFFKVLKGGGQFLMHTDVNVPYILSDQYYEDVTRHLLPEGTLRNIEKYIPSTKRVEGTWIIKSHNQTTQKHYSVRVYTKEEFTALCKKVGFSSCEVYSDWNKHPYSENTPDMIIVANKS